ncbi:MAG TPA: histidinol-phosphate transaminase [Vicinamibacterales bacterium]|nr:histidinol-phosphate transaminase [Vicinamibacterales bacterium]
MTRIQGIPDLGPGLRLHLNENTGGCSPKVVDAVRAFTARGLATYPDYRAAVTETAAFHGVDPDWLVLTNGLDEGVLLSAIAFLAQDEQPAEMIVAMPAFETYITTAKALRARVVPVPPGPGYAYPLDGVLAAVTPQTRLIYINNPNNPTGQPVPKDAIRRVAREAPHAVVFVDEAYHDFMGENFLSEAANYPNVLVGRTFSKAHGLAGMRVGVMIARPEVLEPIRFVMPLFNLNVVAVAALRAALTDRDFTPWSVAQAAESKRLLYDALERIGLRYWKSGANFVLIDGGNRARALVDGLIGRGVLVRDRSKDPYCPNCFRLTTGVVEDTQQAVQALEALCAKP